MSSHLPPSPAISRHLPPSLHVHASDRKALEPQAVAAAEGAPVHAAAAHKRAELEVLEARHVAEVAKAKGAARARYDAHIETVRATYEDVASVEVRKMNVVIKRKG